MSIICDKKILIWAVRANGNALQRGSSDLKNDPEVVLEAIANSYYALTYASQNLRSNEEFILKCFDVNSNIYSYCDRNLFKKLDFVKKMLQLSTDSWGWFNHVSAEIKDNIEIMKSACVRYPSNFQHASNRLKEDDEFCRFGVILLGSNLCYCSNRIKKDREMVLIAIGHHCGNLQYASKDLKNDEDFVLEVMKAYNVYAMSFSDINLKRSKEFIFKASQFRPFCVQHAHESVKSDGEFMLKLAIEFRPNIVQYASKSLFQEKEFAKKALDLYPGCCSHLSYELKGDRDLALIIANSSSFMNLANSSEEIRNDIEIMSVAAERYGSVFSFAGKTLRNNKEFFYRCFQTDVNCCSHLGGDLRKDVALWNSIFVKSGNCLQFAPRFIKEDKELVSNAVEQCPTSLQHASEVLKNDEEVVITAVKLNVQALSFASVNLRRSKEFIFKISYFQKTCVQHADSSIKCDSEFMLNLASEIQSSLIEYASKSLFQEKEFAKKALELYPGCYSNLSYELKGDRDLALIVANSSFCPKLAESHKKIRNDHEIMMTAAKHSNVIRFAGEEIKKIKDFFVRCFANDSTCCSYMHEDLKKDRELWFSLLSRNGTCLQYAPNFIREDRELVLAAVKQNGNSLMYSCEKLKDDEEVVVASTFPNGYGFQYASKRLLSDLKFVKKCFRMNLIKSNHLKFIGSSLLKKREFLMDIFRTQPQLLQGAFHEHEAGNDKELILLALEEYSIQGNIACPQFFNSVDFNLKSDREFMIKCAKACPSVVSNLGLSLVDDEELFFAALKNVKNGHGNLVFKFASYKLRSNPRFVFEGIKKSSSCLLFAGGDLKSNEEFLLSVFESVDILPKNKGILQYCDEKLRKNKDFVLKAVRAHSSNLSVVSEDLKGNIEFLRDVMKVNSDVNVLQYVSNKLKANSDFVLEFSRNYELLGIRFAHVELRDSDDFVLKCVQLDGRSLSYASERLRENKKFVLQAIKINPGAFHEISNALCEDKDVVSTAYEEFLRVHKRVLSKRINTTEIPDQLRRFNHNTVEIYSLSHLLNCDSELSKKKVQNWKEDYDGHIDKYHTKKYKFVGADWDPNLIDFSCFTGEKFEMELIFLCIGNENEPIDFRRAKVFLNDELFQPDAIWPRSLKFKVQFLKEGVYEFKIEFKNVKECFSIKVGSSKICQEECRLYLSNEENYDVSELKIGEGLNVLEEVSAKLCFKNSNRTRLPFSAIQFLNELAVRFVSKTTNKKMKSIFVDVEEDVFSEGELDIGDFKLGKDFVPGEYEIIIYGEDFKIKRNFVVINRS